MCWLWLYHPTGYYPWSSASWTWRAAAVTNLQQVVGSDSFTPTGTCGNIQARGGACRAAGGGTWRINSAVERSVLLFTAPPPRGRPSSPEDLEPPRVSKWTSSSSTCTAPLLHPEIFVFFQFHVRHVLETSSTRPLALWERRQSPGTMSPVLQPPSASSAPASTSPFRCLVSPVPGAGPEGRSSSSRPHSQSPASALTSRTRNCAPHIQVNLTLTDIITSSNIDSTSQMSDVITEWLLSHHNTFLSVAAQKQPAGGARGLVEPDPRVSGSETGRPESQRWSPAWSWTSSSVWSLQPWTAPPAHCGLLLHVN